MTRISFIRRGYSADITHLHRFNHVFRPDCHGHGCTGSWGDTVDIDIGSRALNGECTGQTRDSRFGCRVVGLTDSAVCLSASMSDGVRDEVLQIPFGEAVVMILPYFCFWKYGQQALTHCGYQHRSLVWGRPGIDTP